MIAAAEDALVLGTSLPLGAKTATVANMKWVLEEF